MSRFAPPEEHHAGTPGFMRAFECSGKPIAFVDMDGTAFDYFTARAASGLDYSVFNGTPGSFRNLQPFHNTHDAIEVLEEFGFDVYFLSRPAVSAPHCFAEKVESIAQHFPDKVEKLIFSNNKGVIGRSHDLLIDDHPGWANGDAFPGALIVHKTWNESIRLVADLLIESHAGNVSWYGNDLKKPHPETHPKFYQFLALNPRIESEQVTA